MATDVLPATHIIDDDTPVAAARGPSMLRRLYDAIVEVQTLRARREIVRMLGPAALRSAPGAQSLPEP